MDDGSGHHLRGSRSAPVSEPAVTTPPGDRSHILKEFVSLVAERGYVQAKVGELTARAGVARAHFYELFKGKEDCFLAAQRELAATMVDEVGRAIAAADSGAAVHAALAALTDFADEAPTACNFVTHEATLAGPRAWQERQRMLAAIGGEIERSWEGLPSDAPVPDLPAGYLLGGAIRALGIRMRRGEDRPKALLGELISWIESYQVPKGARRWSSVIASAYPLGERQDVVVGPIEPAPLPRGRHRLPPAVAKRSQRERLLHATGRVAAADGYANATVAEIVVAAGVSREVFYEHFHDKQEAFAETIKFVFEQVMAGSAGAFFSTDGPWPERIWQASAAFTGFIVGQPALVHAVFVESYAVATDVQRSDDFLAGFTVFLEDGYRYRPQAAQVPRIAGEAIGGAVLESINSYLRSGRTAELGELVPGVAYMILAPFMGADGAHEFVVRKARESDGESGGVD
jgi:AcrR family transcriptional regulator